MKPAAVTLSLSLSLLMSELTIVDHPFHFTIRPTLSRTRDMGENDVLLKLTHFVIPFN